MNNESNSVMTSIPICTLENLDKDKMSPYSFSAIYKLKAVYEIKLSFGSLKMIDMIEINAKLTHIKMPV